MTLEREEGEEPKPRYKVIDPGFNELIKRSQHWERIFPEIIEFREKERARIELEAASPEEKREMTHSAMVAEFDAIPEFGRRIFEDLYVDRIDRIYEPRFRMNYLCLYGVMKPLTYKIVDGKRSLDWGSAFDISP